MRPKSNHRSRFHFVVMAAATLLTTPLAQAATEPDTLDGYVVGELLVKFQGGPKSQAASDAKNTMKHEVKCDFEFIGWQHVRLPAGMTVEEGLARYSKLPNVLAIEPNYVGRLASGDSVVPPNDPLFNGQWALTKISASNAWDFATGSTNVVVAVIDTGV